MEDSRSSRSGDAFAAFERLLHEARAVHEANPATRGFCAFSVDPEPLALTARHRPCGDFLAREGPMEAGDHAALRDAMLAAAPHAFWRETYAGTDIGQDFMDRFGCYCIVGAGGGWSSATMSAWMVYMPPGLWYPWHHHPAEEMYLVVAGEAEFLRHGMPAETLRPGETVFHASDQPHAMRTHDRAVLAYVVWRGELGTPPVLTSPGVMEKAVSLPPAPRA